MASPQRENGFTAIAHEILESMQMFKFSLNEIKIILCVFRFTYGFNRKEHAMSLSFFMNHTGLNRSRVNDSVKRLVENNVLVIEKKGDAKNSNSYSFNKNYESWGIERYSSFQDTSIKHNTSVQFDTSKQNDTSTSVQNDTTTSVQNDTSTSVQFDTQERNNKESIKETTKESIPYKKIIDYLNEKAGTKYNSNSNSNKKIISARWNEGYRLEDFQLVIDYCCSEWKGKIFNNGKKGDEYLRPSTLFNGKFDEKLEKARHWMEEKNSISEEDKRIEEYENEATSLDFDLLGVL